MPSRKYMDILKKFKTEVFNDEMKINLAKAQYDNQKSFEDLFSFIWDLEESKKILKTNLVVSEKSEGEADKLRKYGNRFFHARNYELALRYYNMSILNAPHPILRRSRDETKTESHDFPYIAPAKYGGTEGECTMLALAFGNRSAVLFKMEMYKECQNDIAHALEYGYPEAYRDKLDERKVRCQNRIPKVELSENRSNHSSDSEATTMDLSFDMSYSDCSGEFPLQPNVPHNSPLDSDASDTASEWPFDKSSAHTSGKPLDSVVTSDSSKLLLDASATDNSHGLSANESAMDKCGESLLGARSAAENSCKSSLDVCEIETSRESSLGAAVNSDDSVLFVSATDNSGKSPLDARVTDNSSESPLEACQLSSYLTKAEKKEKTHLTIPFPDSIKIAFKPSKGRCLIAARDFTPGQLVAAEDAFCLNIDIPLLHCCTCLNKCLVPLPCPSCTQVVFCNESCRTKGLSEDHWLECKILPTLISLELTDGNLAIKMLKTLSYPKLNDLIDGFEKETTNPAGYLGCCSDRVYEPESYRSIYYLCINKDRQHFDFLFSQCAVSYIFVQLLQQSGRFFVDEKGHPVSPTKGEIIKTGAILISHCLKFLFNQFPIWNGTVKETVATGMFPLLSLLNHSCYPNLRHYGPGRTKMMCVSRPISVGDELTISYSLEFQSSPLEERREWLEKYSFTCTCEACLNEWPTYEKLLRKKFLCLECKMPLKRYLTICSDCLMKYPNRKAKHMKQQRKEEIDTVVTFVAKTTALEKKFIKGAPVSKKDSHLVCKYMALLDKHLQMPCQIMVILQTILDKFSGDGL